MTAPAIAEFTSPRTSSTGKIGLKLLDFAFLGGRGKESVTQIASGSLQIVPFIMVGGH